MDRTSHTTMKLESFLSLKNKYKLVEDLEEIGPETFQVPINDEMLWIISEKCSKLTKMNLQRASPIEGLEDMLSKCTTLHTLKISDCATVYELAFPINVSTFKRIVLDKLWISDETIAHLKNCTNLTKLDITRCHRISDQALESLSKEAPSLEYLSLEGSEGITEKGVEKVLKHCTQIREIDLTGCRNIKSLGLPIEASNLQVLIIEGTLISHPLFTSFLLLGDLQKKLCMPAHKLTNEERKKRLEKGVVQLSRALNGKKIPESLIALAHRTLGEMKKMQSQFAEKPSNAFDKLEEAGDHLRKATTANPKDAISLRILGDIYRMQGSLYGRCAAEKREKKVEEQYLTEAWNNLKESETLDPHPTTTLLIKDVERMQDKGVRKKAKEQEAINKRKKELDMHLNESKDATKIDVSQFNQVVEDDTLKMISSYANLEELNLAECTRITQQGVEFLLQSRPTLRVLNLTNCNGIENLQLPAQALKLEVLHLQGTGISKPELASHRMLGDLQRLQCDLLVGEMKTQRLEKAEANITRVVELEPEDLVAQIQLLDIEFKKSIPPEKEMQKLITIETKLKDIFNQPTLETQLHGSLLPYILLGDVQRRQCYSLLGDDKEKKLKEAENKLTYALNPFLDKLLKINISEEITINVLLADVERMQNKNQGALIQARKRLEFAIEKGRSDPFVLSRLGDIQREQKDFASAQKNLEEALKNSPNDIFILCSLASTLKTLSGVERKEKDRLLTEAATYYATVLGLNKDHFDAGFGLATILGSFPNSVQGTFPNPIHQAEELLKHALTIRPEDYKCLITLGDIQTKLAYIKQKELKAKGQPIPAVEVAITQLKNARANYEKALSTDKLNPQALFKCGEVEKRIALMLLKPEEKAEALAKAVAYLTNAKANSKNDFNILYLLIEVLLYQVENPLEKEKGSVMKLAEEILPNLLQIRVEGKRFDNVKKLKEKYAKLKASMPR